MLFKKIKFLSSLMAATFLCAFSVESLSLPDEESRILVGRLVSLGKQVVEPDVSPCLMDMAMNPPPGEGEIFKLVNKMFPETKQRAFGEVLESLSEKIADEMDPYKKAGRQLAQRISASCVVSSVNPFDLTEEAHGFLQMGHGVIRAVMDSGKVSYAEEKPGHQRILRGLSTIYDFIHGGRKIAVTEITEATFGNIFMAPKDTSMAQEDLDTDFYGKNLFSLSQTYFTFASQGKEGNFYDWYRAAGAWSRLCVESGEWDQERRKSFFYVTISKSMEDRLAVSISGREIKGGEEKAVYIERVEAQIEDYAYHYLKGNFFQSKERTYGDTIKDAAQVLQKTHQMYTSLIASVYEEKTPEERQTFLKPLLEKSYYSSLKASFLEDETTPNLNSGFWWEIIFGGYGKMHELKDSHPDLFNLDDEGNVVLF